MGTTAGADLDLGSEALCDFVESKVELEAGCLVSLELLPEPFGNYLYRLYIFKSALIIMMIVIIVRYLSMIKVLGIGNTPKVCDHVEIDIPVG